MKVLVRVSGKGVKKAKAHIWVGGDTLCRMFSTGGIKSDKYQVVERSKGMVICSMCAARENQIWDFIEDGNYDNLLSSLTGCP